MEPGELQYSLDKVLKKLDALQESVAVLQKLATSNSNSARLVTPSRRPSRWTVNNALLSLVASFLSLKDLVCLLSVLSQIPGQDITFVPGDALVDAMVRRAVPRGVGIKAAALHWVDLCNPSSRHSKFLGIDQLRMLHFFLASIPTDLRVLDNDGRHHPLKEIGSHYRAWGSLFQPALTASSSVSALNLCTMSCRLSAQMKGSTRIELTVQCKQCATLSCPFVVLRSCPVCSEICSGCDSRKHAPVCRVCLSAVCSSCMLTGNNSMTAGGKICKNDGFTCFSCFKVLANGNRYQCAKGDGCPMTHSVCVDCVFDQQILETLSCQGCAKHWCSGCVVFPVSLMMLQLAILRCSSDIPSL